MDRFCLRRLYRRDRSAFVFLCVVLGVAVAPLAAQERFRIYGYLDLEADWSDVTSEARNLSFDVHHFSVVNSFRIDERWFVFSEFEVEHEFAPEPGESGSGLFALERAWVEYLFSPLLAVRAGRLLTPFGIYNQRHDATPTFLGTFLPQTIYGEHPNPLGEEQDLFENNGTGVELLGDMPVGSWAGAYSVYLLNGRGENSNEADDNRDKGIGGRLQIRSPMEEVVLGASYYRDRNGAAADTRQEVFAADVALAYSHALLEVEGVIPRMEDVDLAGDPSGSYRTGLAYYVQGSYRIADRFTPWGRFEAYDPDRDASDDVERGVSLGLNVAVSASAFLKSEVQFQSFPGSGVDSTMLVVSSIAVAF